MRPTTVMLYATSAELIGTVADHLDSFSKYSKYETIKIDSRVADNELFGFEGFASIVIHYSVVISSKNYISKKLRDKIRKFNGPKVLFIQDEMRWVERTVDSIIDLGIDCVFSVIDKETREFVYQDKRLKGVRFETTLTGFVPEHLTRLETPNYRERLIDIGYRARKLPACYGSFAQEKWQIGRKFLSDSKKFGLECDISTEESDRHYGQDWIKFLSNCKATLGVESGSSFIDYSGKVFPQVMKYEADHPEASFREVADLFLEGRDGQTTIRAISPRCFEAAALRTLMIMYEGSYSGVLNAGEHYVKLERDHSNMEEVVAILKDHGRAQEIISHTYQDVACSGKWSLKSFIRHFDDVLSEEIKKKNNEIQACTRDLMSEKTKNEKKLKAHKLNQYRRRKDIIVRRLYEIISRFEKQSANALPTSISKMLVKTRKRISVFLSHYL